MPEIWVLSILLAIATASCVVFGAVMIGGMYKE